MYAKEVSRQLDARGWHSVLCFVKEPPEPVRHFLEAPNVTIELFEESWLLSWRATERFFALIRKYRPAILHLYFTGFLSAYPWIARFMSVGKIYFTDQGSNPEGFVPTRAPLWKRLAMRGINGPITGVINVSGYGYRNFTVRDLLPKKRFHIIYNSVDIERASIGRERADEFRLRYHVPPDRLVVTQVSWLIPEKGLDDLLAAACPVIAAEPRAHFLLAGEGAHRSNLEKLSRELGIDGHVTFTGVVQDPLAEGLYAASDVVCQMSRWEEMFGYVNVEAMATGKPLVGTRVGGIPEIIDDGVTGFLVERRDSTAMAARIIELLRDPELRSRMGEAGRLTVCRRFNLKRNVAQLMELYGLTP